MPSFRHLVVSSGLSNVADGVFQVALPFVALTITRDPAAFASVTVVGRLPWLLVALPAGAFADRLDRRRTMVVVNLLRAVVIGGLAAVVALEWQELWLLYLLAFVLGVGETFFDTAAQSILPSIVGDPDAVARANGQLYTVELTANQFLGPPLGGLLAGIGLAAAVGFSGAAYLAAAGVLLALRGSFRPQRTGERRTIRADVAEGVRYLARHRALRTLAVCVGISNLASTAAFAVFPLYAIDPGPMGLSEPGFGLLLVSVAIGTALVAPAVDWIERRAGRKGALVGALVVFPLTMYVPAVTAGALANGAAFAVFGASNAVWNVITVSLRQRIVPDHILGRVNAGYRLVAWGSMPIGALVGGILGDAVGLRPTFAITATVAFLCLPVLAFGAPANDFQDRGADQGRTGPDVDLRTEVDLREPIERHS